MLCRRRREESAVSPNNSPSIANSLSSSASKTAADPVMVKLEDVAHCFGVLLYGKAELRKRVVFLAQQAVAQRRAVVITVSLVISL